MGGHRVHRRRVRNSLGVVAAGIGDDTAGAHGFVEMSDRIEGAPNLEGPDRLQVLRLDPQRPVVVGPTCRNQRRAQDIGPDQLGGRADVIDAYQLHATSLPDRTLVTSVVR